MSDNSISVPEAARSTVSGPGVLTMARALEAV
jgi:hypothetical protein